MVTLESLSVFPLFKEVSPAVLEKIAATSEGLSFNAGQTVFREGEKTDTSSSIACATVARPF